MRKPQQIETHAHKWCTGKRAGDLVTLGHPTCDLCREAEARTAADDRNARVVFGLAAGAVMAMAIFAALWPLWHR